MLFVNKYGTFSSMKDFVIWANINGIVIEAEDYVNQIKIKDDEEKKESFIAIKKDK